MPRDSVAVRALRSPGTGLALLAAIYVALVMYLLRDVGIANDEWTWLLYLMSSFGHFSSWRVLVAPYNNQPIIGELLLYRVWAGTLGPGAHWALDLLFLLLQAAVAGMAFGLIRRRVGGWLGLAAAALVLFEGRAWETLLFPASLTFVLPTLAVCLAWVNLEHPRIRWLWPLTAATLAIASLSGGLGIAITTGVTVEALLGRPRTRALVALPAAVALVWWYLTQWSSAGLHAAGPLTAIWWGIRFIVAAAGSCFGLTPALGVVVAVTAVPLIAVLKREEWRNTPPWTPRLAGLGVTLVVAVGTTAVARAGNTPAGESRYMYFPAIVLLLLAAELLSGITLEPLTTQRAKLLWPSSVIAVIVAAACVLGVIQLRDKKVLYQQSSNATAARMGAMFAAQAPASEIEPNQLAYTPGALDLFVRRYGHAGIDTERQLEQAEPASREDADQLLAAAEVSFGRLPAGCRLVAIGNSIPRTVQYILVLRGALALRRFGSAWLRFSAPSAPYAIHIAPDSLSTPWKLASVSARGCAGR